MPKSTVSQRADRAPSAASDVPGSQPRVRFQGGPSRSRRAGIRLVVAVAVVVLAVVAGLLFSRVDHDGGKTVAETGPLPENVVQPGNVQLEALNLLDGGNLGSLSDKGDLEGKIRPALAAIDQRVSAEGQPQVLPGFPGAPTVGAPGAALPGLPPSGLSVDERVRCASSARSQPGARLAVYVASVQYRGTAAVVIGFVGQQRRLLNVFVMDLADCGVLLRTAMS